MTTNLMPFVGKLPRRARTDLLRDRVTTKWGMSYGIAVLPRHQR